MAESSSGYNIIIGPAGAGKTALLSALNLAADSIPDREIGQRIIVRPTIPATNELFAQARKTIVEGRLPFGANAATVDHGFEILTRAVAPGLLGRVAALLPERPIGQFSMLDGPGGSLFETVISADEGGEVDRRALEQFRKQQIERIRRATGLIICIDATASDSAGPFFVDLPTILAEVGQRPLQLRRVVIALTKADQVTTDAGNGARDALSKMCPVERVNSLLGRPVLRSLDAYLDRRAELACCWTSIFGFTERGYANFDRKNGGLYLRADPGGAVTVGEAINNWRPHQVLNPFLFLAQGRAPGVMKVSR